MKHLYRLLLWTAVLAMALAVLLPSAAGAKSEGHGKHGRGHSSEARGGHSGKREYSRGGGNRSSGERAYAHRVGDREHADWRGSGDRRAEWRGSGSRDRAELRGSGSRGSGSRDHAELRGSGSRGSGSRDRADWRGSGSRGEVRYRDPRADYRADVRWRDSGRRSDAPSYRSRTRYRYDGPSHSYYPPRYYYTGSFHRPRFVFRSGFSLGFVIGSVPSYGYRYFDPYCDMGFSNLGIYYDHCDDYGHPDAILVLDMQSGYPIASCAYRGGYWVVDDCY